MIDGHRLTARLASGGTSTVYLARDTAGEQVAVKTTRARKGDQTQARRWLRTEAACSRRLPPFCTTRLLVDGSDHSPPYLVSEYVEGPSLAQYVDVLGPLDSEQVSAMAVALARAVAAVHGAGLIHCDLKPGNILLAADGPRVIDFSIAQEAPVSGHRAEVGTVPYSPGWVAPERLRGHPAGPASDIFGWACLVGFAATGRSPFDGEEVEASRWSVARAADLSTLEEPIRGLVEAALAVAPDDRPSISEIVARLGGHGIGAVPAAEPLPQRHEADLVPYSAPSAVFEPRPRPQETDVIPHSTASPVFEPQPRPHETDVVPYSTASPAAEPQPRPHETDVVPYSTTSPVFEPRAQQHETDVVPYSAPSGAVEPYPQQQHEAGMVPYSARASAAEPPREPYPDPYETDRASYSTPAAEPYESDLIPYATSSVDEATAPMPRIAPAPAAAPPPPPASAPPPPPASAPPPPPAPAPAPRDVSPRRADYATEPAWRAEGANPTGPDAMAPPRSTRDSDDIPLASFGPRTGRDTRRPRRLRAVAIVTAPAALVAVLATVIAMGGTGGSGGQEPATPGDAPSVGQQAPADSPPPVEPARRSHGPHPASASSARDGSGSPSAGNTRHRGRTRPGSPGRPSGPHTPGSPSPTSPSPTTHPPTPTPTPTTTGTGPTHTDGGTPTAPGATG